MSLQIPQIGNVKKKDFKNSQVAYIEKVDASYVRKIMNGDYKPKTLIGKAKAKSIKDTYQQLAKGNKQLIKELKKSQRA